MKKEKSSGAICGGNKKEAERILDRDGHCNKHEKYNSKCEKCGEKYLELVDSMFMTLM